MDIPLIHKFGAGFAQGVKDTKPGVKVLSQYLTQTAEEGGFSSPDKGKTAAEGQIEKKADVVYAAAGLSGQGVIEAASANKVWAIGVDSDQYKQEALSKYKDVHPHLRDEGRRQGGVQPREVGRGRQARDRYRQGRLEVR